MGDMAEVFNDLKQATKERREARAVVNVAQLAKLGIPAKEQSKNVFRVDTEHGAVMYYPSSNSWQHKGKVHRGGAEQFRGWLRNNYPGVLHAVS